MPDQKNLNKEKLFKELIPRSRVKLDIVKNLRKNLVKSTEKLPPKILSYQQIIKENGEYYLISDVEEDIMPLAKYLSQNNLSFKYLFKEFKSTLAILNKFDNIEALNYLFPAGINAANFWVDKSENIYLMPQAFLEIRQSYSSIDFDIPAAENFKPPEIISAKNWDNQAYLFNLAAVFYYFLSGETIFVDHDSAKVLNKIQNEKIIEIKYLVRGLPESYNNLLMQLLSKDDFERGDLDYILVSLAQILEKSESDEKNSVFLKSKEMADNKKVSRIRKRENIKLYFRQNWKIMFFFLTILGSLFFGLFSHTPAVITEETEPEQVVSYFYEGLSRKNMNLIDETSEIRLGEMQRIITESHVVEKMKKAFSQDDFEGEIEQVYSLENIKIIEESVNEKSGIFKANYNFKFADKEGNYSFDGEDELKLEKLDGIWRITKIKGSFKQMIEGDYPWRE